MRHWTLVDSNVHHNTTKAWYGKESIAIKLDVYSAKKKLLCLKAHPIRIAYSGNSMDPPTTPKSKWVCDAPGPTITTLFTLHLMALWILPHQYCSPLLQPLRLHVTSFTQRFNVCYKREENAESELLKPYNIPFNSVETTATNHTLTITSTHVISLQTLANKSNPA